MQLFPSDAHSSSPCDGHLTFTSIYDVFRNCLIHIANVNINELQWSQATFPVKVGELGFLYVIDLNFLSQYQVFYSCRMIYFVNCPALPDNQFNSYLLCWSTSFRHLPPPVGTAVCDNVPGMYRLFLRCTIC